MLSSLRTRGEVQGSIVLYSKGRTCFMKERETRRRDNGDALPGDWRAKNKILSTTDLGSGGGGVRWLFGISTGIAPVYPTLLDEYPRSAAHSPPTLWARGETKNVSRSLRACPFAPKHFVDGIIIMDPAKPLPSC